MSVEGTNSGSKTDPYAIPFRVASDFAASISEHLNRLQFGLAERYLLIEQIQIGFGGQISRRLLGLKLALALERKAVFRDQGDPPYLQTLEPQCSNVPILDWDLTEIFDPLLRQPAQSLRFAYSAASTRLKDRGGIEVWATQRVAEKYAIAADANIDGQILKWMRWLPPVQSKIEEQRIRLGVSASTLGVHLRRGDKTVETAYVPASHFNAAIARIYHAWRFDSIFLASDSAKAVEQIDVPPGVILIFDHDEKRYNNANHKMLFRNPGLAWQETFTAAKNLNLLSACGGIVGQDNAHFATLSSAVVASNFRDPNRIILLDGKLAERESPSLGLYYQFKRKVRRFILSRLPNKWRLTLLHFRLF